MTGKYEEIGFSKILPFLLPICGTWQFYNIGDANIFYLLSQRGYVVCISIANNQNLIVAHQISNFAYGVHKKIHPP